MYMYVQIDILAVKDMVNSSYVCTYVATCHTYMCMHSIYIIANYICNNTLFIIYQFTNNLSYKL